MARGFTQQYSEDYFDTYAHVMRIESICLFLIIASYNKFQCHYVDVKTAFLNGRFKEEVYMQQPPSLVDLNFSHHSWKLERTTYRQILFIRAMTLIHKALDEYCSETKVASCVADILGLFLCNQVHKYFDVIQETAKAIGISMNRAKCNVLMIGKLDYKQNTMFNGVPLSNSVSFSFLHYFSCED